MTSDLIKMADVNFGYLKVKMYLLKHWHPKVCKKKNPTCVYGYVSQSLFGITRQSLVMPSSDPRDRIVYPIHKLMIDSYIIHRRSFSMQKFEKAVAENCLK